MRKCIIIRLLLSLVGILLAILVAVLFALGILPVLLSLFPYAAGFSVVMMLALFASFLVGFPDSRNRNCLLCHANLAFAAAFALLIASLAAVVISPLAVSTLSIALVFLTQAAFWITLIGFYFYGRSLARRSS